METLTKDSIKKMKVVELKAELKKRGFKVEGKKGDLIERLKAVLVLENAKVDPDDVENATRENEDDDTEVRSDLDKNPSHIDSSDVSDDEDDSDSDGSVSDFQESKNINKRSLHVQRQPVSFKDIEESISSFSGDDKTKTIVNWIRQFEDLSELCQLTELQMLLYCRRLLKGSAALFIKHERTHKTWKGMSRARIKEFTHSVSSKLIHRELMSRKKLNSESLKEYFFKMVDIAAQCPSMEPESVIQYVIDGIEDSEGCKAMLYGAKTFEKFRKRLDRYETMKLASANCEFSRAKNDDKSKEKKQEEQKMPQSKLDVRSKRCFSCGSASHVIESCPDKMKGPKCFKCDSFGHVAARCPTSNCVTSEFTETRPTVDVIIQGICMKALLDSGSDLTLMKKSEFCKLNQDLMGKPLSYRGIGSKQLTTLGSFHSELVVNEAPYNLNIHVVPENVIGHSLILGSDFLCHASVLLVEGKVMTLRKIESAIPEVCKIDFVRLDAECSSNDPVVDQLIGSYQPNATKDVGIQFDWKKSEIPKSEMEFLSHQVEDIQIPAESKTRAVAEFKPTTRLTPNQRKDCKPFKLLAGRETRLNNLSQIKRMRKGESCSLQDEDLEAVRAESKKNIEDAEAKNRKSFDENRKEARLHHVGDLVAIKRTQPGAKFQPIFYGPYRITEIMSNEQCTVKKMRRPDGLCKKTTMVDYMKPWIANQDYFSSCDEGAVKMAECEKGELCIR